MGSLKLFLCVFYGLCPILGAASESNLPPSVWEEEMSRFDSFHFPLMNEINESPLLNPILWGTAALCDHEGPQKHLNALHGWGWEENYLINEAPIEKHYATTAIITHNTNHDVIIAFRGLEGLVQQMAYLPQPVVSWYGYIPTLSFYETTTATVLGLSMGYIQKGLYDYFHTNIQTKLNSALDGLALKRETDRSQLRLIFTGFGAGGAFAQMATLCEINLISDYKNNANNRIGVVTFASQWVFDQTVANHFDRLIGFDNHVAFTLTQDASSWKTANFTPTGRRIELDAGLYIEQQSKRLLEDPKKIAVVGAAAALTAYSGGIVGAAAATATLATTGLHTMDVYVAHAPAALKKYHESKKIQEEEKTVEPPPTPEQTWGQYWWSAITQMRD